MRSIVVQKRTEWFAVVVAAEMIVVADHYVEYRRWRVQWSPQRQGGQRRGRSSWWICVGYCSIGFVGVLLLCEG